MFHIHLRFGEAPVLSTYLNIIRESLKLNGQSTKTIVDFRELPKGLDLVSVTDKSTYLAKKLKKANKVITWFQGIVPEEMAMLYEGRIDCKPRVWLHRMMEKYALEHSDLSLFVSEAMLDHYRRVYGYSKDNYFIMPCFNGELNPSAFKPERYEKPRFLFSGSMIKWQCIDRMFALFRKIKQRLPEATLTIFTLEREQALELAKKANIDIEIESVDSKVLNERMLEFKYGFIVRDDTAVNNVATPTKMSDYMAAGVVPVYSDVISDYKKHIKSPYVIPFESDDELVDKILEFESKEIDCTDMYDSYKLIFDNYWNKDKYIKELSVKFKNQLKG